MNQKVNQFEDGSYVAIPYAIIYLGTQSYLGEPQKSERVNLTFEIPSETAEFNGVVKPKVISMEVGLSFTDKSKLPGIIQSITGKKLTDEEASIFDLDTILGMPCMIEIFTNEKGYQNVKSVSKLMKGVDAGKLFNPISVLDYDQNWNKEKYEKLPEFMRNKVKSAPQYQTRLGLVVENSFAQITDEDIPFS